MASSSVQSAPEAKPQAKPEVPTLPANVAPAPAPRRATIPAAPPVDDRLNARLVAAKGAEESGDYEAALRGYEDVLAADPRNVAAAEGLSSARRSQARSREAATKARIAEALQKHGDGAYDDAIAMFESVLKQDSTNLEALDGVARARKAKAAEEAVFKSRPKRPPLTP